MTTILATSKSILITAKAKSFPKLSQSAAAVRWWKEHVRKS